MPTTKHRKSHKKKLAGFKAKQQDLKRKSEKAQRDFIMKLIEQERQSGLFEGTQTINKESVVEGPQIDLSAGPII